MEECVVRAAMLEDSSTIEELSAQLGYASSSDETADRLTALLCSEDHGVFVACLAGGMVIGWVHVFAALRVESAPFAELGGFVVAESHRGRGFGRRLLNSAELWSAERGMLKLRVRTRIERKEAHAFYSRMGFSRTKEQRVYDKSLGPVA